ncbi:MAG: 30S ribosomal protein S18 [Candidatus Omnitrophota bacterium]
MTKKKPKRKPQRIFRKRPCRLCRDKIKAVDFKDVDFLSKFTSDRGRILPSRISGNCAKHQRMVAGQIKRARMVALLPFAKPGTEGRSPFLRGKRGSR